MVKKLSSEQGTGLIYYKKDFVLYL